MAAHIHHVQVEDHLHVPGLLQRRDRLAGRQIFGHGEDVRVHDAAGGLLFVLEQVLNATRLPTLDEIQHRCRQLFRQVLDECGRIV